MTFKSTALALSVVLALAACGKPPESPLPASAASVPVSLPAVAASAADMPDRWIGRWQGPEGTFLEIASEAGVWRVTVQNLDGPRSFEGHAAAGGLSFVRDGVTETIHAGHGVDTGMKWLADKRDCLVVKAGEGYCRG